MSLPPYIQLSRKKGWRLPADAVNCSRPGPWGNDFAPILQVGGTPLWRVTSRVPGSVVLLEGHEHATKDGAIADVVDLYRLRLGACAYDQDVEMAELLAELTGRALACWCKPGARCHVQDVLLPLANPGVTS